MAMSFQKEGPCAYSFWVPIRWPSTIHWREKKTQNKTDDVFLRMHLYPGPLYKAVSFNENHLVRHERASGRAPNIRCPLSLTADWRAPLNYFFSPSEQVCPYFAIKGPKTKCLHFSSVGVACSATARRGSNQLQPFHEHPPPLPMFTFKGFRVPISGVWL